MTTAVAIDRLVHHAVILKMNGASYRNEEAKQSAAAKTGSEKAFHRNRWGSVVVVTGEVWLTSRSTWRSFRDHAWWSVRRRSYAGCDRRWCAMADLGHCGAAAERAGRRQRGAR
jgi:hypothetical protein